MAFDITTFRTNLEKQGIAPGLIDVMAKQALKTLEKKDSKPRTSTGKKKGGWYPGMPTKSSKIEADVTVSAMCETCGRIEVKVIKMKIKEDSPREQKVAVSLCKHCPDHFRALSHESLVSFALLSRHYGLQCENTPTLTLIRMARKMHPEEVVTLLHRK